MNFNLISILFCFCSILILGGGLVQAAVNLGNIYRMGVEGIEIDLPKARTYFAKYSHVDATCLDLLNNIDDEIAQNEKTQNEKI